MYHFDLTEFANQDYANNNGICRELALCRYLGIERNSHDNSNYREHSDIELPDGTNISVKSEKFSLMYGGYCKNCKTFEGIWRVYYRDCHSNTWAYVTQNWQCYIMNKKEFSKFVHLFASKSYESKTHYPKIQARSETKALLAWLEAHCN